MQTLHHPTPAKILWQRSGLQVFPRFEIYWWLWRDGIELITVVQLDGSKLFSASVESLSLNCPGHSQRLFRAQRSYEEAMSLLRGTTVAHVISGTSALNLFVSPSMCTTKYLSSLMEESETEVNKFCVGVADWI
jgi:hypothetical protein